MNRTSCLLGPSGAAPPGKVAWHVLRGWLYQDGAVGEMTHVQALSALSAWRSGRALARVSFVAGAQVITDPEHVSWEDFPVDEALEAESHAPPPLAPERAPRPRPPTRTTRPQIEALRTIDRAPDGLSQEEVNSRSARALLDRGLIELSTVGDRVILCSSAAGKALLQGADAPGPGTKPPCLPADRR
ncbi:MAG: hypothetical protein ABJE95_28560 [Byssovorax sp.]